ncbi:MAG: hypothetical protein RIG84_01985 [Roseovarius sp.]
MARAIRAGVLYFLIVFAIGFVLGTFRVLVLVLLPRVGELVAVLIETPVILTACWVVSGGLLRRIPVRAVAADRLLMGGLALGLLLLAEVALSTLLFGRSMAEHLAHYATLAGALGLAGQGVFGAMPLIRLRLGG